MSFHSTSLYSFLDGLEITVAGVLLAVAIVLGELWHDVHLGVELLGKVVPALLVRVLQHGVDQRHADLKKWIGQL